MGRGLAPVADNSRVTECAPPTNPASLRALLRRGLINQVVCAVVAVVFWLISYRASNFHVVALYSFAIGNFIWLFIDFGRMLGARWLLGPEHADRWPGWVAMTFTVTLGAAAGYSAGTALVDAWLGLETPSLLTHSPTGVITLLAAAAATYFFYSRERLQREIADAEAARRAALESQLKLIESQLEPHMLFNTLANLRALIGADPARAQAMLDRLIAYLRSTLNASRTGTQPLAAEFDRLADYLALMQVRMGPRLAVRLNLPDELREAAVPSLLLQPLVENAIKHGLEPQLAGGAVEVSAAGRAGAGRAGPRGRQRTRLRRAALRHSACARTARRVVRRARAVRTVERPRRRHAGHGDSAAARVMQMNAEPTALIAEDEPLLAAALQAELATAWPELRIAAVVGDGEAALQRALQLAPDLCFFDIRMPGLSGLDAARALAEDWPDDRPFPLLVFVTAYDQYALQAFEAQAVDYLVKPVEPARLRSSVDRLKKRLADSGGANGPVEQALAQLRALLGAHQPVAAERLEVIQASAGNLVHMVPIDDVVYFEAADKYVRVVTADREHLIRLPLKDLLPQLDPSKFWQVHRSLVVQARKITSARREESGKVTLTLASRAERLVASRLYAHLFKGM
jgi:DNA-binding LytR/AlgR family response regulator